MKFTPIAPEIIGGKLGVSLPLYVFLVEHQTAADGRVYYGRPFGYRWIRANWPGAPSIPSLKRHMARLKSLGLVELRLVQNGLGGMRVRILDSVKWSKPAAPPAVQLSLLSPAPTVIRRETTVEKPVEKPVENLSEICGSENLTGSKVIPERDQKRSPKEVKKQAEEKPKSAGDTEVEDQSVEIGRRLAIPRAVGMSEAELQARRLTLLHQAEQLPHLVENLKRKPPG